MNNLFFFPLDGGILINSKISYETIKIFDKIHQENDYIILISSRDKKSFEKVTSNLKFDGAILNNGSYVLLFGNEIFSKTIKQASIDNLILNGFYVSAYTINGVFRCQSSPIFNKQSEIFNKEIPEKIKSFDDLKIYALEAYNSNPDDINYSLYPELKFERISKNGFYCLPKEIEESSCIELLRMKFPNFKFISFGINENDISLMANSDIAIAMGNADNEVLNYASFVTKTCGNEGILYAFKTYLRGIYEET